MFQDLYDLQKSGTVVDTRLIVDDRELSIHWNVLDLMETSSGGLGWARLELIMLSWSQESL